MESGFNFARRPSEGRHSIANVSLDRRTSARCTGKGGGDMRFNSWTQGRTLEDHLSFSHAKEFPLVCRWLWEMWNRGVRFEFSFGIPMYRYMANCCINSRLYEPTGIRLTTASQTLTAINEDTSERARTSQRAVPVLELRMHTSACGRNC